MTRDSAVRRLAVAVLPLLLLTAACGESQQSGTPDASVSVDPTTSVAPTPTDDAATPEPTPSPTPAAPVSTAATPSLPSAQMPAGYVPSITCSGEIGPSDPVAIVWLAAGRNESEPPVLRNYSDPANPRTVCEFGGVGVEQLVDARHIVISGCGPDECAWAVVELPDLHYHWFALPEELNPDFIAVSPALDEVAWISNEDQYQKRRLHLSHRDNDQVVARLPEISGRCGSPGDSSPGQYSRQGDFFFSLDAPHEGATAFDVFSGLERVYSIRPPYGEGISNTPPGMPVWSPIEEALYFYRADSILRLTPEGGAEVFLDGVTWSHPTFSPDGRYLAYAQSRDDGTHDVYLVDLEAGGVPELIGEHRTAPVFLTATQLFYVTDTPPSCAQMEMPQKLIYDVNEAAESRSIISAVQAVWPGTSSND